MIRPISCFGTLKTHEKDKNKEITAQKDIKYRKVERIIGTVKRIDWYRNINILSNLLSRCFIL
jgi:hypothetical protein